MATKRRMTSRRRGGRRKRARIARPIRPRGLPSMTVQRTFRADTWTPGVSSTGDFWRYLTTALNDCPNILEYSNLFDTYRINWIKYTLRPRYDMFAGNDTRDTTLPGVSNQAGTMVHVMIDPKSDVVPFGAYTYSVLNAFLENGKVKTYQGTKPISILVKYPCMLDDVNGNTRANIRRSTFLNTGMPNIQHRGVHIFLQDVNMTGTHNQAFELFVTMSVTFKGQR